jgi:hypothetical protein
VGDIERDMFVTTSSEGAWLFTRGRQSVRILRREHPNGRADLIVCGPGTDEQTHTFASMPECMQRQAEIEGTLMAEGFMLQLTPERRREADRRRVTRHERRRPTR